MVKLKSRTQCPVNGFQFIDAAISPDAMQTWDFEELVRNVQSRRQMNPRFNLSTDTNTIRQEVDQQNALRMLSIRGAESYIVNYGGAAPNRVTPHNLNWRSVAGGVKRVMAGAGVLKEWLGDGAVPVPAEVSTKRAATCATCPQNKEGDLTSWFTQPIAERIKSQLQIKNDLAYATPDDDKLGVCEACACPLKLKVHVTVPHIAKHLSDEVKAKLDARCWIPAEIAQTTLKN